MHKYGGEVWPCPSASYSLLIASAQLLQANTDSFAIAYHINRLDTHISMGLLNLDAFYYASIL